jgi:hypothetical protein
MNAKTSRQMDLLMRGDAAINGDQESRPGAREEVNGTGMKTISLISVRQISDCFNTNHVQDGSHDCQARYPVAVEVRKDCDLLVPDDYANDGFSGGLDAGNVQWAGNVIPGGGSEEGFNIVDPPTPQDGEEGR